MNNINQFNIGKGTTEKEYQEAKKKMESQITHDKRVAEEVYSVTSGFRMIAFIVKGAKTKTDVTRKGYYMAYVVNLDIPNLSEWGEIYVTVDKETGEVIRM